MKQTNLTAVAALALLASCASSPKTTIADLTGEWSIVAVDGQPLTAKENVASPYVGFDVQNGRVFGESGCNRMLGTLDTTRPDGEISLQGISSTRMACPDLELEQSILNAFNNVNQYKMDKDGDIELLNADGDVILKLSKRQDADLRPLAGAFAVTELAGQPLTAEQSRETIITFNVADHTFAAATPCNTINGGFSSKFVDVSFDLQTSTLMMCPDTTIEDALKSVMPTITHYDALDGDNLGLYDEDGNLQIVLSSVASVPAAEPAQDEPTAPASEEQPSED